MYASILYSMNTMDIKMSVFLSLLCIVLFLSLLSLIFKYRKLKQTFRNHKKSLRSILKTINSVRYGNLYERVNPANFVLLPNFSESINRMIESIVDRENMINEYQADLNKKIETLGEYIEIVIRNSRKQVNIKRH